MLPVLFLEKKRAEFHDLGRMADLYVQYERTPYFDRQSGMSLEVCLPCFDSA
jgi:hypothetical protein